MSVPSSTLFSSGNPLITPALQEKGGKIVSKGPSLLRMTNKKRILRFLREHSVSSRQDIAKALKLSKNTVSLIVEQLIREGKVREMGLDETSHVGRPRIKLSIVPESMTAVGIWVKKREAQYQVIDYSSRAMEKGCVELDGEHPEKSLGQLQQLSLHLQSKYETLLGIGIGIPGLVDPYRGIVHYSSHLGWERVPVKARLQGALRVPVRVLNNVKAASLFHFHLGKKRDSSLFYLRMDEGVGGSFIDQNGIFFGSSWTAGEIGRLSVEDNGPLCRCGKKGCLETLISVPAIVRKLEEDLRQPLNIRRADELRTFVTETADANMAKVLRETGHYLGQIIPSIIHFFDPERIIIDSPLDQAQEFRQAVLESASRRTLKHSFDQVEIRFLFDPQSAVAGAAQAIIFQHESYPGEDETQVKNQGSSDR